MTGCGPHCGHFNEITELERLRSLIATFVAVDLGEVDCKCEYHECVCEDDAYSAARDALRKAVGR